MLGGVLALVAALLADDDPEAAAMLFGAGDGRAPAFAHTRRHLEVREQAIARLNTTLGEARRTELYIRGTTMNERDAIDYAHAVINHAVGENDSE